MEKLYFCLDLKDDPELIARYRQWHAPGAVPAAINASIRDAGIEALEIFLAGNRLFMVLTPGPAFDPEVKAHADAANPDAAYRSAAHCEQNHSRSQAGAPSRHR